ncbi:MAG: sodium-translocating pyrophosphatase [Candidatus Methylacidiphilales bacterium]|nr:sodium-translocating pyrophosphatase [Candidatus Methylacidiphilales bacterium]
MNVLHFVGGSTFAQIEWNFLGRYGIETALLAGAVALVFAGWLIKWILAQPAGNEKMREIASAIEEGAKAYLRRQVNSIALIAAILFFVIGFAKDWTTSVGFLVGAVFSLLAGYIGMRVAVLSNVRTTQGATESSRKALRVAFNGGAVTGMLVVGLALLSVGGFYLAVLALGDTRLAINSLVGLALGSSLISVFARLGGGIYTKAADVGADLVGKIESNLDEDDPRNPATIADNVGDNVGDCAGMAADVFETYVVTLIGAVLVAFLTLSSVPAAVIYPFLVGAVSVFGAIAGIAYVNLTKQNANAALRRGVGISALVTGVFLYPVTKFMFPAPVMIGGLLRSPDEIFFAGLVGLAMTFIVVIITNYYTATEHAPVRKIAQASETGHATNIIAGLAVGSHATALPVGCIGLAILASYHFAGLFGIAIAAMAMLSMAGIIISLDAFGPITDNAGGIAVMSELPKEVRHITDELDAIGNTMKAVTKGYAIASAGLASLVLFGSYVQELKAHWELAGHVVQSLEFSLTEPKVIIGLFLGGMLPFIFTAYSMDAVGKAAGAVVSEVRRQIAEKPGLLLGTEKADYGRCVDIVTTAALREMILPALLPVIFVVAVAAIPQLGAVVLGGVLVGSIVTGLFVAISMTSSGGAWDNAKKSFEDGFVDSKGEKHFKGSEAHKASVTGDTVGDPYKDTAGPAVNPMIKITNIVALLLLAVLAHLGGAA